MYGNLDHLDDGVVTDETLRLFAERNGGYWNDVLGGEAIIPRGNACLYIAAAMTDDDGNVMPEDLDWTRRR